MFSFRRKRVLFYYPQHFNRSVNGTNPFFDPLIKICEKANIPYDIYEEPDLETDKPHNTNAKSAKCFFWTVIAIRKIIKYLMPKSSWYKREQIVAFIFNILTLGYWKYRKYVSISGSMEEFFLALNPEADVFELQHGVDYSNKISYFDNGKLKKSYCNSRWHLMSWGEGYRRCVIRGHENDYGLKDRVHVVGHPMYRENPFLKSVSRKKGKVFTILFSLQFTRDWSKEKLESYKQVVCETLRMLDGTGYKVLLKHHPRYNNCIDLTDINKQFPFVEFTQEMLSDLQPKIDLHVTLNSTTAFEFAEVGIPTYFLQNKDFPQLDSLFYKEYNYPLYVGMDILEVINRLKLSENYKEDTMVITSWYKKFYSPLDEKTFIKLLK